MNKGFTLIEVLVVIIILSILLSIPLIMVSGFRIQTTSGEHTGYVTSVQHTGIIWQTYDAYFKTSTMSTQEDMYCISSKELADELTADQTNGKNITVVFGHGHWIPLWECNHDDIDVIIGII